MPPVTMTSPQVPGDSPPDSTGTPHSSTPGNRATTSKSGPATPTGTTAKPQKWWQMRPVKILFTIIFVAIVVLVVSKSIKPEEFEKAFKAMKPLWFLAAIGIGMLTWVGAAIPMKVFAPIKVPLRDAVLTQVASSFVGVVAPAGLGSLALSIRFLAKQGMQTTQAVATMVLMELSQFLTSFILVLGAIFIVGISPDIKIPWDVVGWVALGVVVVAIVAAAIPKVRNWVITEVKSVWSKTYPQAIWAFKHPKQLGLAMFGALLQTMSFAGAFMFSLLAFGATVDFWKVGAAYLVANTLGSMIPVPGGVGSIEATLTVGMTAIGVPAAAALMAAVTFRLATFYLQIPIGSVAYEYMQRKKML